MKYLIAALAALFAAQTAAVTFNLSPDGDSSFAVICNGGQLSQPIYDGGSWVMTCESEGPPDPDLPPDPDPPPSTSCANPDPRVPPLLEGQEPVSVEVPGLFLDTDPVSRYFCSDDYPRGIYISWGPKAGTRFSALKMIVSEVPFDTNFAAAWPKGCASGASSGGFTVSRNSGCRVQPGRIYYLSMAAEQPITGEPTCTGRCELILFNDPL